MNDISNVISLLLFIVVLLYLNLVALLHIGGIVTIDEWRASNAKKAASISKTFKRFADFLRAHREFFSPIGSFLKWSLRMLVKCICLLPGLIMQFARWAIRMYRGDDLREMLSNPFLALTDGDIIELTQRLRGNPYDSPTFTGYLLETGVNHYEFCAAGLKESYMGLDNDKLAVKVLHVIRNYIMETRKIQVDIFIEIITPTRLVFAIPVSKQGRKCVLRKQEDKAPAKTGDSLSMLTEEISITDSEDAEP